MQPAQPSNAAHVILLSAADSHQPLIAAACLDVQKAASRASDSHALAPQMESTPEAESSIRTTAQLAAEIRQAAGHWAALQVDVLLVLGPCCTLAGFPPWALQFTQIYHLGALQRCHQKHVEQAMQAYYSTKQRFGK